ncbi:hypothetical protein [Butyrivibrio sp. AE2032]|jgi:hypothetical protein|nr:hypothetical protein [Butyrivibrio sp. AE2032]
MTKRINFKAMLSNLTTGFLAEKSLADQNYKNAINGGYSYSMRARTIL